MNNGFLGLPYGSRFTRNMEELVTMDTHFEKISGLAYRLFASPESLFPMKHHPEKYSDMNLLKLFWIPIVP